MNILTNKNLLCSLLLFILTGCNRINNIIYSPQITPKDFLSSQPWISIKFGSFEFVLCQPTSTLIVFFLGVFTLFAGYKLLSDLNKQKSRLAWGVGLLLTGAGAIIAGTSYQAFGYEIKCMGRDFCTWTSWWEIIYLFLTSLGLNIFLIGSAFSSAKEGFRKIMIVYAISNSIIYSALLIFGALIPVKFLVSFEFLVLLSAPTLFFLIGLHYRFYLKHKDISDKNLRNTWLIIIPVALAYYVWLRINLTQTLWQKGIWFSENDLLHIGMIWWVYYVKVNLPKNLKDLI